MSCLSLRLPVLHAKYFNGGHLAQTFLQNVSYLIIINLIYIAQFDTSGIVTALYIVTTYIQMQYVHI